MPRLNQRTLINMGRKAGLRTTELYSALASCASLAHDFRAGERDTNGFVANFNAVGHRVYLAEPKSRAG